MSKYTLAEAIRDEYSSPHWVTASEESERYERFDRMLNRVKADAWDEAIEHVSQLEADVGFMDHYKPHNPYRDQEEA